MIPKGFLITIIVVLTILLVTAVFVQKQTIKKVYEEKETFLTSTNLAGTTTTKPPATQPSQPSMPPMLGDGLFGVGPSAGVDPSGASGTGFGIDAIINLKKQLDDVKNTQNTISKATSGSNIIGPTEFIKFRDTTSNQIRDISASNSQFQTLVNTRFTGLQDADSNVSNRLNAFGLDITNRLNATNSNVAVINGKLVSMDNIHTSNFNVINSNINDIRDKQTAFDAKLNTSAANIQNIVKAELSSVTGMLSSKLLTSSGSVQTLSNDISALSRNYTAFSTNQTKFNTDTQTNLNSLKQASMDLSGSIALAQQKLIEVNDIFANYTQKKDMANYALKTDLLPYASRLDLNRYVTVAESSKFASKMDLMNTSAFVSSNVTANYLTKGDASNAYALKTDLRSYALSSNLPQQYLMRNEAPLFATKNELNNYTLKTELAPVNTAVTDAKRALDTLKPIIDGINADYVKKTDLPALTAPGTAATAQMTMALDAARKTTDALTASLGAINASLSDYVTKVDAQAAYANFASKADMTQYAKKQEVPIMFQPLMSTIQNTYASKADIAQYAKLTDLGQYAKTADVTNTFAPKAMLGEYVKGQNFDRVLQQFDGSIQQRMSALAADITRLSTGLNTAATSLFNIIQANDIRTNKMRVGQSTWNQSMPSGWSEGLMSSSLYTTGSIGAGAAGAPPASTMSSTGEITGRKFKSLGDSNWNWYHMYRNEGDQLFFGADDTKRGIQSKGSRDFSLYMNDQNRMTFTSNGNLRVDSTNTAFNGPAVFNGDVVFTKNATMSNVNVNGGLGIFNNGVWGKSFNTSHPNGRYTHINWPGDGKNYIRNEIILDAPLQSRDIIESRVVNPVRDDPDPKVHIGWDGPTNTKVIIGPNKGPQTWIGGGVIDSTDLVNLRKGAGDQLNIEGTGTINFGSTYNKKDGATGRIGYGTWDGGQNGTLNIVGGAAPGKSRTVTMWDNLVVNGNTWGQDANYKHLGAENIWTTTINPVHAHGTVKIQANQLHTPPTITTPGRMHIDGGENLYLLNRGGTIVSKAWGGNGNLTVEGHTNLQNTDMKHANIKNGNGSYTHFNYGNESTNYIRGKTFVDGDLIVTGGAIYINGLKITADGNGYAITAANGQQINGGNTQDRLWVRNRRDNSGYWYWNAQTAHGMV